MKDVKSIISAVIIAGAVIAGGYLLGQEVKNYSQKKLELEKKSLFVKAIDTCSHVSRATWIDKQTGSEIIEPYQPAYEKCMKDLGY